MAEIQAAQYIAALKEQRNAQADAAAEWRALAQSRDVEVADLREAQVRLWGEITDLRRQLQEAVEAVEAHVEETRCPGCGSRADERCGCAKVKPLAILNPVAEPTSDTDWRVTNLATYTPTTGTDDDPDDGVPAEVG